MEKARYPELRDYTIFATTKDISIRKPIPMSKSVPNGSINVIPEVSIEGRVSVERMVSSLGTHPTPTKQSEAELIMEVSTRAVNYVMKNRRRI